MRRSAPQTLLENLESRLLLSGDVAASLVPGTDATAHLNALLAAQMATGWQTNIGHQMSPEDLRIRIANTSLVAPLNLTATVSRNEILLHWTYPNNAETGFLVYRSTDGVHFTLLGTTPASENITAIDTTVAGNTKYYYYVEAYNGATASAASTVVTATTPVAPAPPSPTPTPTPTPTPSPTPAANPVTISVRYGSELVIAGTTGNDSINVTQSGTTLTIAANGQTYTEAVPSAGLFIYTDGGNDNITVAASVTLRTTVVAVDNAVDTITSHGTNVNVWCDSIDTVTGSATVHAIASFYGGVSKAPGAALAEPADSGALRTLTASLWGVAPLETDVNQGSLGDCYFLATLASLAHSSPGQLEQLAVDLGDGTYAVQFDRNGVYTYVRVDSRFPSGPFGGLAYDHPGSDGDIWSLVLEKAYAAFRTGANTYNSLNSGWMGNVFNDFGIANAYLSLSVSEASFYATVSSALAAGDAVTVGTYASAPNLVGSHAYSIVGASKNASGQTVYLVRNPWGVSGDALENSGGYATLTYAQMQANFAAGAYVV